MSNAVTQKEIEDVNSFLQNIKEVASINQQSIDSVNNGVMQIGNIYLESKRLDIRNAELNNELARILSEFKLKQGVLNLIFSERGRIIDKHFEVIDKGLREGNDALILQGLRGASEFVMKNPLEDFDNFKKAILDKNTPLELDF
ncbi:hypothetical protein GN157_14820 [Flavobacterium rakeshii]|uniref:Uncharacterized protein n=1 Tax=Flavobacterium rakeshii TaxID=1038845 RepID=A0A6N8HGV9_9FLAO|nr:hypothetical protein [Flavobacterium rakeshii]MUV04987.1 hypothetical protein [Flavobacterium rakeshii]